MRIIAPAVSGDTIVGRVWQLTEIGILLQAASGSGQLVNYDFVLHLDTAVYGSYKRPILYGAIGGAVFMPLFAIAFTGLEGDMPLTGAVVKLSSVGAAFGAVVGAIYGARVVRYWSPIDMSR